MNISYETAMLFGRVDSMLGQQGHHSQNASARTLYYESRLLVGFKQCWIVLADIALVSSEL